jgi:lipid-binding SYLF domain-containing protein
MSQQQEKNKIECRNFERMSHLYTNSKKKIVSFLTMERLLKQARESFEHYLDPKLIPVEQRFSRDILRGAQGIAFITQMKAGLSFGVSGGSGIIFCRNKNGDWSGPCAIGMGGVSWGFAAGISKVDLIVILPTIHHVRTFMANSSLQIRGNVQACVADIGRDANVGFGISENAASPIISYSFSTKGLYGGVNIESAIMNARHGCNEAFYGRKVSVEDIANGNVQMTKQNEDYETIVRLLNNYCESMPISTQSHQTSNETENHNKINDHIHHDNNNIATVGNSMNHEAFVPGATQSPMQEKPPLLRQNEISPQAIPTPVIQEKPPLLRQNEISPQAMTTPTMQEKPPLLRQNEISPQTMTTPIMHQKPPLLRQGEVSMSAIMEHDNNNHNNNTHTNEMEPGNSKNIESL